MGIYRNKTYTREVIPVGVPFSEYSRYILENFHENPIISQGSPEDLIECIKNHKESDVYIDFKILFTRLFVAALFRPFGDESNLDNIPEEKRQVVENIRLDLGVKDEDFVKAFPEFDYLFRM